MLMMAITITRMLWQIVVRTLLKALSMTRVRLLRQWMTDQLNCYLRILQMLQMWTVSAFHLSAMNWFYPDIVVVVVVDKIAFLHWRMKDLWIRKSLLVFGYGLHVLLRPGFFEVTTVAAVLLSVVVVVVVFAADAVVRIGYFLHFRWLKRWTNLNEIIYKGYLLDYANSYFLKKGTRKTRSFLDGHIRKMDKKDIWMVSNIKKFPLRWRNKGPNLNLNCGGYLYPFLATSRKNFLKHFGDFCITANIVLGE